MLRHSSASPPARPVRASKLSRQNILLCSMAFALAVSGWTSMHKSTLHNPQNPSSPHTALSSPSGTATSITKDGVTWTFSTAVPVGQFVNGDYYVVGPVTVNAITPQPTTSAPFMNGSVKNLPTKNGKSGFDSRLNDGTDKSDWFDASLRSYPPIHLNPGDALVSTVSLKKTHSIPEIMRSSDMNASPVASASVLTVLVTPPPPDAFRPSYCDRNQSIYRAGNLRRDLLPSVPPPHPERTPKIADYETLFRPPWIDTNYFLFDVPANYMPSYGRNLAFAVSYAALLLSLDFPPAQKVNLTNYLVQYGIDLYGCVQAGVGWPAFGGHHSGRKLPILLAGILLNDDGMKNVSKNYPDKFGEDMQTLYVKDLPPAGEYQRAWQGATAIYGGHYGVHADSSPVKAGLYGPYEQLQPKDWPVTDTGSQLGESYRRCCTSFSWVGEALAIHLLHAESIWNHPAFFDYVHRWMNEDDTQAIAEIKKQTGADYSVGWARQRQTRVYLHDLVAYPTFIDDMWTAYHW
jgi:hypothetical protein